MFNDVFISTYQLPKKQCTGKVFLLQEKYLIANNRAYKPGLVSLKRMPTMQAKISMYVCPI